VQLRVFTDIRARNSLSVRSNVTFDCIIIVVQLFIVHVIHFKIKWWWRWWRLR